MDSPDMQLSLFPVDDAPTTRASPIVKANASVGSAMATIGTILSDIANVPAPVLAEVVGVLRTLEADVQAMVKLTRPRIIQMCQEEGTAVTEKGTRKLTKDGWTFEVRPSKTGVDPQKLAALLIAKGLRPKEYMREKVKITYEVDADGVAALRSGGILTADEIATCNYEESWTVLTPTRSDDE